MNIIRWHPDRVFRRLLSRLPNSLQGWVSGIVVVGSWYGLISSSLSILSDIRWAIDGWGWLLEHSGAIRELIFSLGRLAHVAITYWRQLTNPFFEWLFGWLPFEVPHWLKDLLIIAIVYVSAYARGSLLLLSRRGRAFAEHAKEMKRLEDELHRRSWQLDEAIRVDSDFERRLSAIGNSKAAIAAEVARDEVRLANYVVGGVDPLSKSKLKRQLFDSREQARRFDHDLEKLRPQADGARDRLQRNQKDVARLRKQYEETASGAPKGWVQALVSAGRIRRRALFVCALLCLFLAADFVYVRSVLPIKPTIDPEQHAQAD